MPTTFTHAAQLDAGTDRVAFGSGTLFDLTNFTYGMLVFLPTTPTNAMLLSRDNASTAAWTISANGSGVIDCNFRAATTNQLDRFNGAVTQNAWNWIWATWNGSIWGLSTSLYGAAPAVDTRTNLSTQSGALSSQVGRVLRLGQSEGGNGAMITQRTAFIGVWNTVLSNATMQTYSADMIGSGGAAASVEYWKWTSSDTASITGGIASTVGTYTSISLANGPDGTKPRPLIILDQD